MTGRCSGWALALSRPTTARSKWGTGVAARDRFNAQALNLSKQAASGVCVGSSSAACNEHILDQACRRMSSHATLCRLWVAGHPTCTHGYALRNAKVAQTLLRELGTDVAGAVDLVMAHVLQMKRAELPSYVVLPPPIAQLYRTSKRKVCSLQPIVAIVHPATFLIQAAEIALSKPVLPSRACHRYLVAQSAHKSKRCTCAASLARLGLIKDTPSTRMQVEGRAQDSNPSDVAAHGTKLPTAAHHAPSACSCRGRSRRAAS